LERELRGEEKMDKEAIELMKTLLSEIPSLRKLNYDAKEILNWFDKVSRIVELLYGKESTDYSQLSKAKLDFEKSFKPPFGIVNSLFTHHLIRDSFLHNCEKTLKSVLHKCEMSEIEDTLKSVTSHQHFESNVIQLFDAMQFHPKVIQASKTLFEDRHYAQAIFEAFKAVENFVQDKADSKEFGTRLMDKVFDEKNPIIKVPEGGHYYEDVQRGFKHLFVGATQAIRNPKAHKEIIQKDPYITLEYLGFASFLLKRINYWDNSPS
jgi:uncharacterized protein (TIGR02391 family)